MSKPIQPTDSDPKPTPREYAELLWLKDLFSFRHEVSQKPDSGESERPEAADDSAPLEDSETRDSEIRDSDTPEPSSGAGDTPSQLSDPSQSPSSAEKVTGERTHLFFGGQSPLADPLSHQRALHRLIPPREKSWDRQIDLAETVRQTAAAGGDLQLSFRYPKERRGHLVILVSDGVALAPWYPVIEQYRRLAQTCGAFRSISRDVIRIPAHADRDFPETPTGIRPGKDNLILLIHDGLGDGMIKGTLGRYLQRQVQGLGEQAKIAWLHPWQESTWPRTSVSRLPVRSIESADGDSLVVPILPIESRHGEAGLKALEGWFTGHRISGIRARQLPVMESSEQEKAQPDRRQATERSVEEWCTRFDRLVEASGQLTGNLLRLAASFSGRTSVQILSVVAEEVLSVDEDIREPIARAITSGFLRRARAEKPTEITPDDTEEVTEKVALEFHPNAREAVLKRMEAEDVRAIHEACERLVQSDHKQIPWKKYWQVDLEKPDETGVGSELISKSEWDAIRKYGGLESEDSIIIGALLSSGDSFSIRDSNLTGRITAQIGAGGQGQVFKAQMSDGTTKAVKIFHQQYLQENGWLKQKIPALVHKGSPGDRFLWPEGIVEVKKDRSLFGYVMPLKPSEYKDAVNFLVEPLSYRKLLRACTQISKSFEELHSLGLCYRDMNYNNVCINPETGDSLMIDNDNVDFDSDECQIAIGFPSFTAPEVLNGSRPSSDSDRHSLAVLYYYLFFKAHPLDGKAVLQYDIWGADDQNAHYKSAVYHFHPEDKSNEALEISEDDEEGFAGHRAIVFRKRFPDHFLAHFDKTFVQGMKKKYMRTIESVWRDAFDTLAHQIIHCRNSTCMDPQTGPRENFYRGELSPKCYHCNSELSMLPRLNVMPDNKVIVLTHDIKLRGRHIGSRRNRQEPDQVLAEINVHPERNIWGLKNNSNTNWFIQFERDGDQIPVEHGKRFSLDKPEILVDFKNGRKGIIHCGSAGLRSARIEKVLFVNGSETDFESFKSLVIDMGSLDDAEWQHAPEAATSLDVIKQFAPDLVILNVHDESGLTDLFDLIQEMPQVPFVFRTSHLVNYYYSVTQMIDSGLPLVGVLDQSNSYSEELRGVLHNAVEFIDTNKGIEAEKSLRDSEEKMARDQGLHQILNLPDIQSRILAEGNQSPDGVIHHSFMELCRKFEHTIQLYAGQRDDDFHRVPVGLAINMMKNEWGLEDSFVQQLHRCWSWRNRYVHGLESVATLGNANYFLETLETLEEIKTEKERRKTNKKSQGDDKAGVFRQREEGVADSEAETSNFGERPDSIAGLTPGEVATLEEGGDRALQLFWSYYFTLEQNVTQQYKSKGGFGKFRGGDPLPSDPEAYFDAGDGPTSTELEQLVSQVMDRLRVKAVEGGLVNLLRPGKSSDPIGVIWNPFLLHLLKDHMDSLRLRNNTDSETPPLHRQSFSQSTPEDKTDGNREEFKTESGGWWQNLKEAASGIVDKITRTGLENLEVEILEKLQKEMEAGDRKPEDIQELKEKFEKVHRLDPQAILSTSEQLSDLGLIEEQGRLLDLATSEGCDEAKVEHARWIMLQAKNREDQIRSEKMLQELVVKDEENTSRKALEILSTLVPSSRSANESWAVTREGRLRFWDAVESGGLAEEFKFSPHKTISAEGLFQQASVYPIPEGEIVLQWVPGEVKLILQNRDQTKMKQFSAAMKSSGQLETGLESGLVLEPKPSPDWNEFQYSVKLHRYDRREAQNVAGVMSHQFRSMIDKWDELQKTAGSLLPLDAIVDKIIALGVPGLVLLVVMATSGYAGAAAITFSLAALGGPAGMVGGVAVLGLLGLLSKAGAEYGFETIYQKYLTRQLEDGRTVADLKNEIHQSYLTKSLKTKVISFIEEMEQKKTDSMSEDSPSSVKHEEEEIPMSPEVAIHPFWSEFFRLGVPLHPELADKTPTGNNMRKIGPGIGNRIQIDVNWTPNVVSLRPLSSKPENLRPLLEDRDAFEKEVGVPEKWNEGTDAFLGITLLPAPKEEQAGWSTEQQVTAALELYGRIKDYLQKQM